MSNEGAGSSMEPTEATERVQEKKRSLAWLWMVRYLYFLGHVYNRLEVRGVENIPNKGEGGLLVSNHPGLLDPAYIHMAVDRQKGRWMRWLGWSGLFKTSNKFFKWVVHRVESIVPVDEHEGKAASKDSAKESIDNVSRELQEGHLVGIFPEGRNHQFGDFDEPYKFRTGAMRLAIQNRVPIIPVGVYGTHRVLLSFGEVKRSFFHMWITIPFWLPAKVRVIFGEPFEIDPQLFEEPDNYELLRKETDRLRDRIYELTRSLYL